MTKVALIRSFSGTEHSFLANVIECHHSNPVRKLRGLRNLVNAGHFVALPVDMDRLTIDGCEASWIVLEEWAKRTR